jgi:anti-sigma regulatory factor (Ser/Thr protein kinase)
MSPPPEDGVHETTTAEARRAAAWVLEIPPEAAYVSTARLFVGAVARHFGVDESSIGDLKLAVSEACNGAIRVRETEAEDRSIRIEANRNGTSLSFEIEDAVDAGSSPVATSTEDLVRGLGLELIHALFPHATMKPSRGGGRSVRLALPVDEPHP